MKTHLNVNRYQCDGCGKEYKRESSCIKHEQVCSRIPENKPICYNCKNLDSDGVTYCKVKNIFVFTKKGMTNQSLLSHADFAQMPCAGDVCEYFCEIKNEQ